MVAGFFLTFGSVFRNAISMIKRKFSFTFFGTMMFLSGLGLICFCCYVAYDNIYPVIFWTKAPGKIIGTTGHYSADAYYEYEKAIFTDHTGKEREVIAKTSAGESDFSWKASGDVTVYYDPADSSKATIFMWRNFLGILFLPFGMLLVFLGWPVEKVTAVDPSRFFGKSAS